MTPYAARGATEQPECCPRHLSAGSPLRVARRPIPRRRCRERPCFPSTSDPEHPGKAVAWAVVADPQVAPRVPGELVANTLDQLRAMLPAGLIRHEATQLTPPEVVETWD